MHHDGSQQSIAQIQIPPTPVQLMPPTLLLVLAPMTLEKD